MSTGVQSDEALQQAFAELDSRLASWQAALTDLERALAERPVQVAAAGPAEASAPAEAAPKPEPTKDVPAEHEQQAAPEQEPVKEEPVAKEPPKQELPKPPSARPQVAKQPTTTLVHEPPPPAPKQVAQAVPEPAGICTDESDLGAPAPNSAQAEAEEALLATLDPETAQAVNVLRRLSITKKTVAELIEECRAMRAQTAKPAEAATRGRFWRTRK